MPLFAVLYWDQYLSAYLLVTKFNKKYDIFKAFIWS